MRLPVHSSWQQLTIFLFAAACTGLAEGRAQTSPPASSSAFSVDAVKAAYIVNFIRFTEWPAAPSAPADAFVIGVVGNRELEDQLWKITAGKMLQNRRVRVIRLNALNTAVDCQVLYIQSPANRVDPVTFNAADWLHAVQGRAVLTIANEPGFLEKGGIVNFYAEGKNLKFEISPRAGEKVSLQLSSRLLALARVRYDVEPSAANASAATP